MSATLESVLDLTERVQAAINGGDWQLAHELEVTRRELLERLVADAAQLFAPASELPAVLAQLEERSRRLIGEVHHHRRRILREASMIKTGHAAVEAYGAAPGPGTE
jgi:hypothetical protein